MQWCHKHTMASCNSIVLASYTPFFLLIQPSGATQNINAGLHSRPAAPPACHMTASPPRDASTTRAPLLPLSTNCNPIRAVPTTTGHPIRNAMVQSGSYSCWPTSPGCRAAGHSSKAQQQRCPHSHRDGQPAYHSQRTCSSATTVAQHVAPHSKQLQLHHTTTGHISSSPGSRAPVHTCCCTVIQLRAQVVMAVLAPSPACCASAHTPWHSTRHRPPDSHARFKTAVAHVYSNGRLASPGCPGSSPHNYIAQQHSYGLLGTTPAGRSTGRGCRAAAP